MSRLSLGDLTNIVSSLTNATGCCSVCLDSQWIIPQGCQIARAVIAPLAEHSRALMPYTCHIPPYAVHLQTTLSHHFDPHFAAAMETRRLQAPEYTLEVFADPASVKDVVKGALSLPAAGRSSVDFERNTTLTVSQPYCT